ncbi:MAG: hypothetical protein R2873_15695 [Caldilineaceae bacterium]
MGSPRGAICSITDTSASGDTATGEGVDLVVGQHLVHGRIDPLEAVLRRHRLSGPLIQAEDPAQPDRGRVHIIPYVRQRRK